MNTFSLPGICLLDILYTWLLIAGVDNSDCQVDHIGRQFVTAFLSLNSTLDAEILIIPQVAELVNVSIRAPAWPDMQPIGDQLTIGHSRAFSLTSSIRMKPGLDLKGIEIQASADIAVYSINKAPDSKDAILVLPTDALGYDYIISSFFPSGEYVTSIGIVTSHNDTELLLSLPVTNKSVQVVFNQQTYSNGDVFRLQLQAFETFQLESENDLSGVKITSNNSFAIITGSSRKNGNSSDFFYDLTSNSSTVQKTGHVEEQMIPSNAWGTSFIALPFSGNITHPDTFKVTASCDNTTVVIKSQEQHSVYILGAGDTVEATLNNTDSDFISITSNRPVSVLQYYCSVRLNQQLSQSGGPEENETSTDTLTTCDPYLVTIPPLEQQKEEYVFSTPSDDNATHAITVVINSTTVEGLLIDNQPHSDYQDNSSLFSVSIDGYDSNFTAMRLFIRPGYHNISHKEKATPFSAVSHAAPLGMRLGDLTGSDNVYPVYNIDSTSGSTTEHAQNVNNVQDGDSSDGGSEGLPANVIAIIVTLTSAIFFVGVCILGFVLAETVCRRGTGKVSPFLT